MGDIRPLVSQAADRTDEAVRHRGFTALVERFQDMVFGCAYARLRDFHLAQDASQESFLVAY